MIRNLKTNRYIQYDTNYFHTLLKQHTAQNPVFRSTDLRKLRTITQKAGTIKQGFCPLCLDVPYSECIMLEPCSHFVCEICIKSLCTTFKNNICKCPICRQPIQGPENIFVIKTETASITIEVTLRNSVKTHFKNYLKNVTYKDNHFSYKNIGRIVHETLVNMIMFNLHNTISHPEDAKNIVERFRLGGNSDVVDNADLRSAKMFHFALYIDYYSHNKKIIDRIIEHMYNTRDFKDNLFIYNDSVSKQPLWKVKLVK